MKSLFLPAAFRLSALMALVISSFFSPASHAQLLTPAQQVDSIVAVVEDDVILRSELDRAVSNILAQYADRRNELPPENVLRRQVLERLILIRLQVQRAGESGVRVTDPEIETALQGIRNSSSRHRTEQSHHARSDARSTGKGWHSVHGVCAFTA